MHVPTKKNHWKDLPGVWRLLSLRSEIIRSFYRATTFGWPLYDLRYYLSNLEAKRLYRTQKRHLMLDRLQKRVINELVEKGISVTHIDNFLPPAEFRRLQGLAEALVQTPENQTTVKQIQSGTTASTSSEKSYLVQLFGNQRILALRNGFLDVSLNDKVLEVVCGYLGIACRLLAVDLWCNVPTGGPATFSQRWHRDPDDRKLVKLFLYLRDVRETTGPFCYIPGTHNGGPFRNVYPQTIHVSNYPPDGAIDKYFPEEKRLVCVGDAGTLILCDTTGFHKGGFAVTEPRLLLNAVYMTNAGALSHQKRFGKNYSISDSGGVSLGSLAAYAIGLQNRDGPGNWPAEPQGDRLTTKEEASSL